MTFGIKQTISLLVVIALAILAYFYFSPEASGVEKECRDKAKWSIDTMNAARTSSGLAPYGSTDEEDIYRQCMKNKS